VRAFTSRTWPRGQRSINVLPDFAGPNELEVVGVVVNGVRRKGVPRDQFQIPLDPSELGTEIVVELCPTEARNRRNEDGSGA
jgi:hypothetical protein